jgi:hypothetical protein
MYSNILAYQANLHSDRRRPQTIDQRNHKVEAASEGRRANYWVRSGRRLKAMFGRKRNSHSVGHGPSTVELFVRLCGMEAPRVVHLQEGTGMSPRRANVLFAHTGCLYLRWDLGVAVRTAAMSFRKGSPRHSLAGKVFVAAMLTGRRRGVSCNREASTKQHRRRDSNLLPDRNGTARRRDGETSLLDWVALLIPLAIGILGWRNGLDAVHSPTGSKYGVPAGMHLFMGSVCLLAATGDVHMLMHGGVPGTKRIARHLWRMRFGLFIAAGSFFLGDSNRPLRLLSAVGLGQHLSPALFSTSGYLILSVPPLIFWLVSVRFTNAFKGESIPVGEDAYSLRH